LILYDYNNNYYDYIYNYTILLFMLVASCHRVVTVVVATAALAVVVALAAAAAALLGVRGVLLRVIRPLEPCALDGLDVGLLRHRQPYRVVRVIGRRRGGCWGWRVKGK
jgi:hypothetical protein